jgi:endonuclease III
VTRGKRAGDAGPAAKRLFTLREAVHLLGKQYGPPTPLPTSDPFELILWENVAYLAPSPRRRDAFEELKRTVGTSPEALRAATQRSLERITGKGILKSTFADKLRECAAIAINEFGGDLGPVIDEPLDRARRALQSFPGIGEPGAEKILLFTGRHPLLAPDSNGLRVLVRLGLLREETSYARTYAASREVAKSLPQKPGRMQQAHLLLQQHGQTLCKRGVPICGACPLARGCAHARRSSRA